MPTNPVCAGPYEESVRWPGTGCEHCGYPEGDHWRAAPPVRPDPDGLVRLSDMLMPEPPRIRWWWSRGHRELVRVRYARQWMAAMWAQAEGRPVLLARIEQRDR